MARQPFTNAERATKNQAFEWADTVQSRPMLSNATHHFAVLMASKFLDRGTHETIWSNKAMARKLGKHERSVQRCIKELIDHRLLEKVRREGVRRTLRLVFMWDIEHDKEGDKPAYFEATVLSPEHDKPVAPYKETQINTQSGEPDRHNSWKIIYDNEVKVLQGWRTWIEQETDLDADEVFEALKRSGGFGFPCRYPTTMRKDMHIQFFKDALAEKVFHK